jgi:homoserine acetyltransferase
MWQKFDRRFSARDGLFDFFGQFEVERYLNYNGHNFVSRFDANSFLYLAKALDLYDVAWGYESMADAFSRVTGADPVLCLQFRLALPAIPDRRDGTLPAGAWQRPWSTI